MRAQECATEADAMLVGERRRKIIDILHSADRAQVDELAERLGVSASTIRRDLQLLSRSGVVERTHGGVLPPSRFEPSFRQKETEHPAQKRAIATAAARLVQAGQSLFLDAGTSTLELARALRARTDVTIATNSVPIAVELATGPRLILTGGTVKEVTLALVGPLAELSIEQMHVDIAFIGTNGVSADAGFTTPTLEEAATKSRMIQAARMSVVLADGSKLGAVTFAHVARLDEVDLLITDLDAPLREVDALRAAGLEVVLASETRQAIA
jgi:DeoR/GlpR family transcriptional regulator of sugar metabolism